MPFGTLWTRGSRSVQGNPLVSASLSYTALIDVLYSGYVEALDMASHSDHRRAKTGGALVPAWKLVSGKRSQLRRFLRNSKLLAGVVIVLAVVLAAVFAPLLAPQDPNKVDLRSRLVPPGGSVEAGSMSILGTDQLGRDLLSRMMFGARVSLTVGLVSVLGAGALGVSLGLLAGYYGGGVDSIIMRVTDILMSLPFILLALLVVGLIGSSLTNVVVVFSATSWYVYARMARVSTLSLKKSQYVDAARAAGARDWRILLRHILPNLLSPVLVIASFEMARIITAEAGLGFWGLGVPPPDPSWGNMLSDGREYIQDAWWIAAFPGLALLVTAVGINLLGDGLRDVLDPTLKV